MAILRCCLLLLVQPLVAWHTTTPAILARRRAVDCMMTEQLTEQQERVAAAMEIAPAAATSARSTGLALALDDGTRKSHSMAENTAFVAGFFKGIATKDAFAELVCSLYHVYSAMETAFDDTSDPNVRALDYPELRRVPSLEQDMAYYYGDDWRQVAKPSAATREYVDRIRQVARDEPELLVAHMYTRYLGDLFGGQVRAASPRRIRAAPDATHAATASHLTLPMLTPGLTLRCACALSVQMMGGMARSSLQLDKGQGTRFYEFDDIASGVATKGFIEGWYERLNALSLSEERQRAIVDEGNQVFALNIKVFDELKGRKRDLARAVFTLAWNALRSKFAPQRAAEEAAL
jgi:heme oxygenase